MAKVQVEEELGGVNRSTIFAELFKNIFGQVIQDHRIIHDEDTKDIGSFHLFSAILAQAFLKNLIQVFLMLGLFCVRRIHNEDFPAYARTAVVTLILPAAITS